MSYNATVTPNRPNSKHPFPGVCIYCRRAEHEVRLTNEHIVPYSLGGNDLISKANCDACADKIKSLEQYVAQGVFGKFRHRGNTQSRNKKNRPKTYSTTITHQGHPVTFEANIDTHPFALAVPHFNTPKILVDEAPGDAFGQMACCIYPFAARDVPEPIKAEPDGSYGFEIRGTIDPHKFGRVIAKIVYCYAVSQVGLDGIPWHPELIKIILSESPNVPYLVGCERGPIPPFDDMTCSWRCHLGIVFSEDGRSLYWMGAVRLFAYAGSTLSNVGLPVYAVVLSEALLPNDLMSTECRFSLMLRGAV